jgi:hypothetical protein
MKQFKLQMTYREFIIYYKLETIYRLQQLHHLTGIQLQNEKTADEFYVNEALTKKINRCIYKWKRADEKHREMTAYVKSSRVNPDSSISTAHEIANCNVHLN